MAAAHASLLAHLDAARDSNTLSLAYASIGDEGCNPVARFVRDNSLLKSLDLRGNNIRADGAVVLAHAIKNNDSLQSVCLKWNHIGSHPRGIQAICDVLKTNKTITQLDLRNNKIEAEGGAALAEMLKGNSTVTHIDMSWNDLGVEGGKALLEGIQTNHALLDCQLSGNRIAEDTLHAIAYLLRRNRMQSSTGASLGNSLPAQNLDSSFNPQNMNNSSATTQMMGTATPRGRDGRSSPLAQAGAGLIGDTSYMRSTGGAGGSPTQSPPQSAPSAQQLAHQNFNQSTPQRGARDVSSDEMALKLLQRERDFANTEDARFFGEIAEYIDLLQLDVARNKKYRMDSEERERVVTKGFMEREMRYAAEMRELEQLLAKAKADKDDLIREVDHLNNEIERVKTEKNHTIQDRLKLEEIARATADRLRCDIRDGLTVKADLETEIYKVKRRQQEEEEENQRLRTYLARCKEDLEKALR
mmetsp:Transcript_52842/g.115964  ORF Transcript_52842/g.115964 Transcript_52842/m.115964 type:complete len:472 (+) Transcript_52842:53-1468(+)